MKEQYSLGSHLPDHIVLMLACSLFSTTAWAAPGVINQSLTPPVSTLPEPAVASEPAVALDDEPLSLDDSIRLALRNHGDVIVARQQLSGATQRIQSARSARAPQVTGNINSNYQNGSVAGSGPGSGSFSGSGTSTGIGVSQTIYDGGRTRERVRQANASTLGTVGSLGSTRSSLAFEVAQNFYEQLRQERLQQQRQAQLELAQKQLEQIQAQVAEGVAARVDIQSVQVTVSQSRFDLVTAQNALRTAAVRLRNALGLPAGPPLKLQSPPETEASEVVVDSLEDSLALAKRLSPDLVQARANILSGESTIALARIEARPQISATTGYNLDPRAIGNRGLTAGLGVSIPIFNGGGRRADVRAATSDAVAAQERLAQLEKDIATDVEATHTDIAGQVERLKNARELVASAQFNLNNATEKYRVGLGIALDIVNAQSQLFDAQTSVTQARFDVEIARANFDRAVGRFAWAQPGQAPPDTAPTITEVSDSKRSTTTLSTIAGQR